MEVMEACQIIGKMVLFVRLYITIAGPWWCYSSSLSARETAIPPLRSGSNDIIISDWSFHSHLQPHIAD